MTKAAQSSDLEKALTRHHGKTEKSALRALRRLSGLWSQRPREKPDCHLGVGEETRHHRGIQGLARS